MYTETEELQIDIGDNLRKLGISPRYKGYQYLIDIVSIYIESGDKRLMITKDVYPATARKFKTSPYVIERNVRHAISIGWRANKRAFDEIAGFHLQRKPTNSEFADRFAHYMIKLASGK